MKSQQVFTVLRIFAEFWSQFIENAWDSHRNRTSKSEWEEGKGNYRSIALRLLLKVQDVQHLRLWFGPPGEKRMSGGLVIYPLACPYVDINTVSYLCTGDRWVRTKHDKVWLILANLVYFKLVERKKIETDFVLNVLSLFDICRSSGLGSCYCCY